MLGKRDNAVVGGSPEVAEGGAELAGGSPELTRGGVRAGEPKRRRLEEPEENSSEVYMPTPRISNVVSTFKSGDKHKKLDLMRFSQVHGFEFQPSR